MATQKIPEKGVLREDGCICPEPDAAPKPSKKKTILTCPADPRFPNTNQTRHCYISFLDYQRCARLLGDYPGCKIFYACYTNLCPSDWVEKWFNQMEAGTFPRKIYPPKPIVRPDPTTMGSVSTEEEEEEISSKCT